MQLTKRERILIFALVFVLLWGVFLYLIFIPQHRKGAAYAAEVRNLQMEKADMDGYLDIAEDLAGRIIIESRSEDEFFYSELDDVEADQILQQLAGRSGVELISLEIESAEPVWDDETEAVADKESIISRDNRPKEPGTVLMARTVRMNIRGCGDNIMAMADAIRRMDRSLVVAALDVTTQATESEINEMEGTLTVIYYFIEP